MNTTTTHQLQRPSRFVLGVVMAGLLAAPLTAAAPVRNIAGTWGSNWGPVTFQLSPVKNSKKLAVKGSWVQGAGTGQITRGTFNPMSRKLEFSFYQSWNDEHGSASLVLSRNGKNMAGPWKHSSGRGTWTMYR